MSNVITAAAAFFVGILLIVAFSALLALPVMLLWDAVIPDIFGLKTITFMQAWGLSLLSGLLFKSTTITKSN